MSEIVEREMVLVTGTHCMTDEIRSRLDELISDMNFQKCYGDNGVTYTSFDVKNNGESELYVLYISDRFGNRYPVGLCEPVFDHSNNLVSHILPRVFLPYRQKGFASYMLAWCIDNYFKKGFRKICTQVWGYNKASLALSEKFLIEEGVFHKHKFLYGEYHDVHYFGLLKSQYEVCSDTFGGKLAELTDLENEGLDSLSPLVGRLRANIKNTLERK